jgi:hypothetical protein
MLFLNIFKKKKEKEKGKRKRKKKKAPYEKRNYLPKRAFT